MTSAFEKAWFARRAKLLATAAGLAVLSMDVARVNAAARTWLGTAGDSALGSLNWDTTPVNGDSWIFPATPTASYPSPNLNNNLTTGTGWTVTGISFLVSSPALVIGDGSTNANVGNTFTASGTFSNASTNIQTINNPFTVVPAGITVGTNGTTGGAIVLTGNIAGTGGLTIFQSATLSGNNTFGGILQLPGGSANTNSTLSYSSINNLGLGTAIALGNAGKQGILKYTGIGETINRNINLSSANNNAASSGVLDNSGSGTLAYSGTVTEGATVAHTLYLQGTNVGVLSGGAYESSTGTLSVLEQGSSTWILSGTTSNYRGSTSISSGTLAGIGSNAFGNTSTISIAAAGVLSLRGDSNTSFVKASDNITLYPISTSASAATINVDQSTGAGTAAKTMTIGPITTASTSAAYSINFTGADNTGLTTGAVTGPASTAVAVVTLNNTNTSGTTTIASYTSANTTGGETLTVPGIGNTTINGTLTPSATALKLSKSGTGVLTLSASSGYTGGTTVQDSGGILAITNGNALGTGAATIGTGTSGPVERLQLSNNIALNSVPTINLAGANVGSLNVVSGARIENLSGANSIASNINVSALGGQYNIYETAGSLTFSGNLSTNLASANARNFAFGGPGDAFVSGSITNGATTNVGLIKDGTGSLTLSSNASTYSITTTVNGGKLLFTNTSGSATGTSSLVVNSATTAATVAGTGISSGLLTATGGSHIAPGINTFTPSGDSSNLGNYGAAGTLSVGTSGGLTLNNANLDFDLASTGTIGLSDLIRTGNTLTLTSAVVNFNSLTGGVLQTGVPYVLIAGQSSDVTASIGNITATNFFGTLAGGYTATYSSVPDTNGIGGNDFDVTFAVATPEPSTVGLLSMAAVGLLARRRRTLSASTPTERD